MENINKFISWLKQFPIVIRTIIMFLICALLVLMSLSACGTPKTVATVQNVNPNSTVTVTLSVSNETTNTVDGEVIPSVNLTD